VLAGKLHIGPSTGKIVYLAPLRALVQEKVKDWKERWASICIGKFVAFKISPNPCV